MSNIVLQVATQNLRTYVNQIKRELESTDPAATGMIYLRMAQVQGVLEYMEQELKGEQE